MREIIFWIFASIASLAAIFVILAKNPVRAVLALIVVFLATAATWLTLDAEFVAFTLVLVYVGAVMVLFVFVVMLLDIRAASLRERVSYWLFASIALSALLYIAVMNIMRKAKIIAISSQELAYGPILSNTELLGLQIFEQYLLQFEIAGILLLVAIVAAISLIYRGPRARKVQNITEQIKANPHDRIRLV